MSVVIYKHSIVQQMLSLSQFYHLTLDLAYFKRGSNSKQILEMLNVLRFLSPATIENLDSWFKRIQCCRFQQSDNCIQITVLPFSCQCVRSEGENKYLVLAATLFICRLILVINFVIICSNVFMHDIGLISQVKILINSISIIDARDENYLRRRANLFDKTLILSRKLFGTHPLPFSHGRIKCSCSQSIH